MDDPHAIGKLCVAGDWACTRGDLSTLASIARRLAEHAREPLHCELSPLADLCGSAPERATAAWMRIKQLVQDGFEPGTP